MTYIRHSDYRSCVEHVFRMHRDAIAILHDFSWSFTYSKQDYHTDVDNILYTL